MLGFEPSYSGYMILFIAMLTLFLKGKFDLRSRILAGLVVFLFTMISSKGAVIALVLAIIGTGLFIFIQLIRMRQLYKSVVFNSVVFISMLSIMLYLTLDPKKLADFYYNVFFPLTKSEEARRSLVFSSDYRFGSFTTRYASMLTSWEIFKQHPLFGVGVGMGPRHFYDYMLESRFFNEEMWTSFIGSRTSKNFFFQNLVEGGLIGISLLISLIVVTFKRVFPYLSVRERISSVLFVLLFLLGMLLTERVPFLLILLFYYMIYSQRIDRRDEDWANA